MNINDLDLNLLRLFDAVYTYKKVSLAADSLGISQPAASQGLSRLRSMFNDSLFVRATGGVKPTPRAERLATSVRNALDILNHALTDTDIFDPAESQRVFRIHMMSDMGEDRFLPGLLAEIEHAAPRIKLETVISTGLICLTPWITGRSTLPSVTFRGSMAVAACACSMTATWCCQEKATLCRPAPKTIVFRWLYCKRLSLRA